MSSNIRELNKSNVRILDVGCGEGDELYTALSLLPQQQVAITANDTSLEALQKYQQRFGTKVRKSIAAPLEKLAEHLDVGGYDLILLSHCLYGIKDVAPLLQKYLEHLSNNGILCIFQDAGDSDLTSVQKTFWPQIHGVTFDETRSDDIMHQLHLANVHYQSQNFPYTIDLRKLELMHPNGIAELFLPFALRVEKISSKELPQIEAFLSRLAPDQQLHNWFSSIILRKP
ncbi:MAG: class I SAM-dependent methyltransferase [Patescibacteria group bacterium]